MVVALACVPAASSVFAATTSSDQALSPAGRLAPAENALVQRAAHPAGAATGSASYSDPAADATLGGLDVTNVTVANNDQPNLHFSIPFPAVATLPTDVLIDVFFDTDLNPGTGGGGSGAESAIEIVGSTNTIGFYRWNGSAFLQISAPSLKGNFVQGLSIDILASEIGAGSAFNFWIVTLRLSGGNYANTDRAPNSGSWRYNVVIGSPPPPPPTQKLKVTKWDPEVPRAGEVFATGLKVVDPATNKVVSKGDVACDAQLGGRALRGRGYYSFDYGGYLCNWTIPRTAAGKTLIATEEVSHNGAAVSRTFQGKVRAALRKLKIVRVEHGPPVAGAAFQATVTAHLVKPGGDTDPINGPASSASCAARIIGGSPIPTTKVERFANGVRCTWFVPTSARGRKLLFTVTIRAQGQVARTSFQGRAR